MKKMAERYVLQHKEQKETEVHKQYLLEMLKIQKGTEPPVYQKQEVNFRLQNPFEGKFKQIKKQSYTIRMTDAEQRELNRYQ